MSERATYLRRIDHPALVRVHRSGLLHTGALEGWGFVEMDYVDGRPLTDAPGDWRHLDDLLPLADALDLLHAGHWSDGLPLVHRDVKPANIVAAPGRLVLVDPSTLRGVNATALTRIGTPVFAAPEVVTGRAGPAADVYSFAVTALALLSGARGEALAELVAGVADLDVPAGIRAGLAPHPQDRPVACRDVLTDPEPTLLRDSVGPGQPAAGWSEPGEGGDARPPPRRVWPWLVVLTALLLGPVAAAAAGVLAGDRLAGAATVAAGLHLGVQLVDRRSLVLAAVAPSMAWAFLIGDRVARGRRRAWAHALLCGPLTVAWLAPLLAGVGALDLPAATATTAAGLGVTAAAAAATRAAGGAGLALRLALLPAWGAGAAVLLAAGVLALLPALLIGQGRVVAHLLVGTIAGGLETFRGPRGHDVVAPNDEETPHDGPHHRRQGDGGP